MNGQPDSQGPYPVLITALVAGIRSVLAVISFATLIFSGRLAPFLSTGIDIALISAFIIGTVVALAGTYRGTIAIPQDKTAVIIAFMVAGIAASLPETIPGDDLLRTVIVALAITSCFTGLLLLVLGILKLGGLVRYIPYPVIGGFIAGTGWLLVQGSMTVMLGRAPDLALLSGLAQPDQLLKWMPGVVLAVILFAASKRVRHFLVMPTLLVGAIWVYYGLLLVLGHGLEDAGRMGLMLGPFPEGGSQLAVLNITGEIHWPALVGAIPDMLTVAILSVVALLLYAAGIELAVETDIDLDRELRAAGMANLLASVTGGIVGFHALSLTVLTHHMKAASRWTGVLAAGICGLAFLVGAEALTYFPRAVLAGLLLFLGMEFLYQWIVKGWRKLPHTEYLVVWVILFVVAGVGFLEGVLVGIVAGLLLTVFNYGREGAIQFEVTGSDYTSNVERSVSQQKLLKVQGPGLWVLKLRGFLFFGTSNGLLKHLRERAGDQSQPPLRYVLLDFRLVSGLDSSAVISLVRIKQLAEAGGFLLGFAGVPLQIAMLLENGGLDFESGAAYLFEDLDHALEYCENRIIAGADPEYEDGAERLSERLRRYFPPEADVNDFFSYCTKLKLEAGFCLMYQGGLPEDLFFIESGRVAAVLSGGGARPIRLKSMGPGTVVGEIGLYLNVPRTATVIAETPCVVYRLTKDKIAQMRARSPLVAAAFHQYMVCLLAERLADSNRTIRAILD